MPFVCDIRINNRNAVIDFGDKIFINGTEHTPTNLAPVPLSAGPAQLGGSYGVLSTRWVYRSGDGLTGSNAEGNADTAKFSCGQECFTDFVRASSQPVYYGIYAGGSGLGGVSTLSQFDSNFRAIAFNSIALGNINPGGRGAIYTFFPIVNNRWIAACSSVTSYLDPNNRILSSLGSLTESGTGSTLVSPTNRHFSCTHIGNDWVLAIASPWTGITVNDANYSINAYAVNRQTGTAVALTGLTSSLWISISVGNAQGNRGTYTSNSVVESTVGSQVSQVYFYHPVMTATALTIFVGTVGAMDTANPTMTTATAGSVLTAVGGGALDTSQVVYPAVSTQRMVRCWVFEDAGVKYLCCYVFEPGSTTTVATSLTNLYLWRLDSKTTATFLQRVNLGDRGRVRSILPLSTAQKDIVVVTDSNIQYFSWNSATNWTFRSSQSVNPKEVGVDAQGRTWVVDNNGDFSTSTSQGLYLYEGAGSAANISVVFSSVSYAYTGTPLSASVVVNAYDVNGTRVPLAVTLSRDTTNFEFAGGASTVNVTTSASADTTVPITITGAGRLACLAAPTV
jgi:hypothetical protein